MSEHDQVPRTATRTAVEATSETEFVDEYSSSDGRRFSYAPPYPPAAKVGSNDANAQPSPSDRAYGSLDAAAQHRGTRRKPVTDLGEVPVKATVVDLGSGSPRDQIQEAVTQMALAWNRMVTNLSVGVEQLIQTISHPQFKKADAGFFGMLWSQAEKLLLKTAEHVAGTALAGEIGLEAIKKMIEKGDDLERERIQADKDGFASSLRDIVQAAQLEGVAEGGNQFVHKAVTKLDSEFVKLGKHAPQDAYKQGDHGVVGAQAAFLKDLLKRADDYTKSVPTQADFAGKFFIEYVKANHKKRKRSAWRSPFAESEYDDGYVEVDMELDYNSKIGWFFTGSAEALSTGTLRCPDSDAVAKAILRAYPSFELAEVDLPVQVRLNLNDGAWDHAPEMWKHDRTWEIKISNGTVTNGIAKQFWAWATTNVGTTTHDVLSYVRNLKG